MLTRLIKRFENKSKNIKNATGAYAVQYNVFEGLILIKDSIKNIDSAGIKIMPAVPSFNQMLIVSGEDVSICAYEKSQINVAMHNDEKKVLTGFFLFFIKIKTASATADKEEMYNNIW
ncbi:hypothetical protein MASR1M68_13460 [Elusimicrobiota bacterium]